MMYDPAVGSGRTYPRRSEDTRLPDTDADTAPERDCEHPPSALTCTDYDSEQPGRYYGCLRCGKRDILRFPTDFMMDGIPEDGPWPSA